MFYYGLQSPLEAEKWVAGRQAGTHKQHIIGAGFKTTHSFSETQHGRTNGIFYRANNWRNKQPEIIYHIIFSHLAKQASFIWGLLYDYVCEPHYANYCRELRCYKACAGASYLCLLEEGPVGVCARTATNPYSNLS